MSKKNKSIKQNFNPPIEIIPRTERIKLLIQINCFNEEKTLPETLADLPKQIKGVDIIEIMIVDDGSSDNTVKVAREHGVHHIIRHSGNKGLPTAVNTGVFNALKLGADILVNTDADNQYKAKDIEKLVTPILKNQADFVYGQRPIWSHNEFSYLKKVFQNLGAKVVSKVSGVKLDDAASGFRAINRNAMQSLYLLSDYASPLENLIQARKKRLNVATVDIGVNAATRPSRLFKSIPKYIMRSARVIIDNILLYHPTKAFGSLACLALGFSALVFASRYYLRVTNYSSENLHLSLLVVTLISGILGVQLAMFAFSARLNKANRRLLEEIMYRQNGMLNSKVEVEQFSLYQR